MKAFVLCGGKGTRLRPYTYSIPKSMLPLGDKPILEFVINNLHKQGITDITLTVGYLKEQIKEYFGDGGKFGVKIRYLEEEKEMNTAGSIKAAEKDVKETFLVLMGDHLTNINFRKMVNFHKKHGGIATIGLKRQGLPLEYGIAKIDANSRIVEFEEKPIIQNLINAGIYVFEPEIFGYIEVGLDFARDVFPKLLRDKKGIYGYVFDEYWMDIGRIHDYEHANQIISMVSLTLAANREKH
ncbi:MAG: nucleotidyltransferase family protein [Candidatus Micrarchaeia archaeon]